jgi:hypothetical protein
MSRSYKCEDLLAEAQLQRGGLLEWCEDIWSTVSPLEKVVVESWLTEISVSKAWVVQEPRGS